MRSCSFIMLMCNLCFFSCGDTSATSAPDARQDGGQVALYTSPYGEYYLRLTKLQSCKDFFDSLGLKGYFLPVGTESDFILNVVYDLSNFYKKYPPKSDAVLAKFLYGNTSIVEVVIDGKNHKFFTAWPDPTDESIMNDFSGQFATGWESVVFKKSVYISDSESGGLSCTDEWYGQAQRLRQYTIPDGMDAPLDSGITH